MLSVLGVIWLAVCVLGSIFIMKTPFAVLHDNKVVIYSGFGSRKLSINEINQIRPIKKNRAIIHLKNGSRITTDVSIMDEDEKLKFYKSCDYQGIQYITNPIHLTN